MFNTSSDKFPWNSASLHQLTLFQCVMLMTILSGGLAILAFSCGIICEIRQQRQREENRANLNLIGNTRPDPEAGGSPHRIN